MLIPVSALLLAALPTPQLPRPPCPAAPQAMPPAIESVPTPATPGESIAFAAEPWEYPGRAWVFRLIRRGPEAKLEIVRLLRRSDCNLWALETRWEAPLSAADYRAVAQAIEPWITVPPGFPDRPGRGEIAIDGTATELRVTTTGWEIRRTMNHYGQGGDALSAIFHRLLERHVPADEWPAGDWRTRRAP